MTWLDHLRDFLVAEQLVRPPDVAGAGARPWLPPVWRHPDGGAIGPGDAADQQRPDAARDDGLVVSLMRSPGMAPGIGEEERRVDGVDIVLRGVRVQTIDDLEREIRYRLIGDPEGLVAPPPDPGGRTDWVMAGLYVIQSRQWSPFQPVDAEAGVFTFRVSYLFELRA